MTVGIILSSALGCSEPPPGSDAGPPSGEAGSHVWVESSAGIELTRSWAYENLGATPGPGVSGTSCLMLDRAAMSAEQLAALEQLVLIPLTDACTYDGFEYRQLKVLDRDGSAATYRDTGCRYLRVDGALAMLPQGSFPADVFPLASSNCALASHL